MSLIICSNFQDDYNFDDEVDILGENVNMRGFGSSAPNSFTNHFSNVFKIEKNSEVAVQSVKIERSSLSNIRRSKFFSVYLGPQLTATTSYADGCVLPIVCCVERGQRGVVALGHQLDKKFQEDGMDLHPDFCGNCEVKPHFQHLFAQQGFTGWNFTTKTSGDQLTTNNATTLTPWLPCGDTNSQISDYSSAVSGGAMRVTRDLATGEEYRYVMGIKDPLSLTNGIFEFRPFNKDGGTAPQMYWEVGLCRATDTAHIAPDWCDFSGYAYSQGSSYAEGFMDYKLTWAEKEDGKRGMRIEQAIVDDDGLIRTPATGNFGQFKMIETKYFGVAGSTCLNIELDETNCRDVANLVDGNTYYSRFRFKAVGEEMLFQAFGQSKSNAVGSWYDVINSAKSKALTASKTGSGKMVPSSFKPINQNCWNLYPKINLLEKDDFIDVEVWGGRANSGTFPVDNITPGTAYWAQSWDEDAGEKFGHHYQARTIQNIDLGMLQNGIYNTSVYQRLNLDADSEGPAYVQGVLPQATKMSFEGWANVVVTESNVYNSILGDCGNLLGFPQQSAVMNVNQGVVSNLAGVVKVPPCAKWVLYSGNVPSFASQPAFIRCPTLTHESLNMAKQLPSKILYSIPRFTNTSKEFGNLYFEPGEKTYLKLRNTEELNINELQLDIVNTAETLVDDLRGQTNVVLHFRKSRD